MATHLDMSISWNSSTYILQQCQKKRRAVTPRWFISTLYPYALQQVPPRSRGASLSECTTQSLKSVFVLDLWPFCYVIDSLKGQRRSGWKILSTAKCHRTPVPANWRSLCNSSNSCCQAWAAIHSTSTSAPMGKARTLTHVRACCVS